MPYSRIYDTREIGELLERLRGAPARERLRRRALRLRARNETPLAPIAALFTPEVRDACSQTLYGDDYRHLGYDDA